jgi:hypothetical protein
MLHALTELRKTNPLIENTLTCLERENMKDPDDKFPEDGGIGAFPRIPNNEGFDRTSNVTNDNSAMSRAGTDASEPAGVGGPASRRLTSQQNTITGVYTGMAEPDTSAMASRNDIENQTIGTTRARPPQTTRSMTATLLKSKLQQLTARSNNPAMSADNAVHTVLYPFGKGGWHEREDKSQCSRSHHRKARLGSVATPMRAAQEYLWNHFQTLNKSSLHGSKGRTKMVNPTVVLHAKQHDIDQHRTEARARLDQSNPEFAIHIDVDDTFTKTVGASVVGGKAYWYVRSLHATLNTINYVRPIIIHNTK